ncbi:unnamed protein product [Amoebophrya sp. A25]|nr:unnamed protein product [Amoebophrya sp. A25]|eukprot:GSA25T00002201001.1
MHSSRVQLFHRASSFGSARRALHHGLTSSASPAASGRAVASSCGFSSSRTYASKNEACSTRFSGLSTPSMGQWSMASTAPSPSHSSVTTTSLHSRSFTSSAIISPTTKSTSSSLSQIPGITNYRLTTSSSRSLDHTSRRHRGSHLRYQVRWHGHGPEDPNAEKIPLVFLQPDGSERHVKATVGKSLLEVAHANDIPIEGACEGSLACSTCHVILSDKLYKKLDFPTEDEEDMLDLAPELTETSRLGCQCIVSKKLYENEVVTLPSHTLNFYVDGHKPVGH